MILMSHIEYMMNYIRAGVEMLTKKIILRIQRAQEKRRVKKQRAQLQIDCDLNWDYKDLEWALNNDIENIDPKWLHIENIKERQSHNIENINEPQSHNIEECQQVKEQRVKEIKDRRRQQRAQEKQRVKEIKDCRRQQRAQEKQRKQQEVQQRKQERRIKAVLRRQKKIEAERKRQNVKESKIQREQKLRRRLLLDEDIYLLKSQLKHDPLSFTEKCEIQYKLSLHDTELKRRARQVRNHKKYPGKRRRLNERFQKLLRKNNMTPDNEIITDWGYENLILHDDNPEWTVDEIVDFILNDDIENTEGNTSPDIENTVGNTSPNIENTEGNTSPGIENTEGNTTPNIENIERNPNIENTEGNTNPDIENTVGNTSPDIENTEGNTSPSIEDIERNPNIENIGGNTIPDIENIKTSPRQCKRRKMFECDMYVYVCPLSPRRLFKLNMFLQPNTFKGGGTF